MMETVPLLARGVPARVAKLRAFGNAVNPFNIVPIARAIQEADPVTWVNVRTYPATAYELRASQSARK